MQFTDKQLQTLSERRIATLATLSSRGVPHLTAVWFLFKAGKLYFSIPSSSVKMRNLQANSNISVLIECRETLAEYGVSIQGHAQIIGGEKALVIGREVHAKYIKPRALKDPAIGGFFAQLDDTALCVTPENVFSWDMADLDKHVLAGALSAQDAFYPTLK